MKVLKPGSGQKGWSKEFVCTGKGNGGGGCGAELLVEEGDLFRTMNSCMGETEHFTTFECKECKVWTDIDAPRTITENLPFRGPNSRNLDSR